MSLNKLGAALVIVLSMIVVVPTTASAAIITLTPVIGDVYGSSVQNPCIYTNPPCLAANPAAFPSVAVPQGGGVSGWGPLPSSYIGADLLPYLNDGSLVLGLDINDTGKAQTLTSFTMTINGGTPGQIVDTYTGFAENVPSNNNGTGFADYLLTGFSPFDADDTVVFNFFMTNTNDGTENIFLVAGESTPTPNSPVPEPASMLLLGTGLLAVVRASRRKTN